MRLLGRVGFVLAHHAQEVFGKGKLLLRNVEVERFAVVVVALDGVGVGDDDREQPHWRQHERTTRYVERGQARVTITTPKP